MPEAILLFLREGRLPGIELGCSTEAVRRSLGDPTSTGNPQVVPKGRALWTYAGHVLQLGFRGGELVWFGFVLINKGAPGLPPALGGDELPFDDTTELSEFEALLTRHGIAWVRGTDGGADAVVLRVGAKARALFDGQSGTLEKVVVDAALCT